MNVLWTFTQLISVKHKQSIMFLLIVASENFGIELDWLIFVSVCIGSISSIVIATDIKVQLKAFLQKCSQTCHIKNKYKHSFLYEIQYFTVWL